QRALRVYLCGFLVLAAAAVVHERVFLVYGLTGFFHAALVRPWPLAFAGLGAFALVVHAHIVLTESTPVTWAIYVGVVVIQTVATGAGLFLGAKVAELADERRRAVQQLEAAIDENDALQAQLVARAREGGVLDERERMAGEIHDTVAQGLAGVITQLEAVHQAWGEEAEMRRHLDNAADLARRSLDDARRSVRAIRPAPLDGAGLAAVLDDVARRWSAVTSVAVDVHTTGDRRGLEPDVEVALLRAAQEALANVAKHACASRVAITLSFMDDGVALDVRDDGAGFDRGVAPGADSFGLTAMRARVGQLDGTVQVESAPGEGTALAIWVPTARAHEVIGDG
ncbi:MAG: sensor histidine kinase, partial [Actinomycetota bacterium]|nr:sensor histidine kinase [Actinomycetota bacterium]